MKFAQTVKEYQLGPALALSAGIVLAAIIAAYSFYAVRALSNTLTVTGSATATSTADTGKLYVTVSRGTTEDGIAATQSRIAADTNAVIAFYTKNGIAADAIETGTIAADREYSNNEFAPRRYNVRQDITITSPDPYLVEKLSKDITDLSARGIFLNVNPPQYYISDLPELRVRLIGEAVKDAKARAASIAKSAGQGVGRLQSASSGVVQVMA
ncbi:MAG: SIMPL domain-containing protein, partial [Candidatus Pacebacteria bacterium]|nr:SIMPL domain-containing protein [Candidatus Paceibacterota bacterium]